MSSKDKPLQRLSKDEYFYEIAKVVASRSTCARRAVGCVLVDVNGYIIGTGYNGVPAGAPHCTDVVCPGVDYGSGDGLDSCYSIHAEQNALAHCADPQRVHTVYLTVSPCMSCMKLLLASSARRIVAGALYNQLAQWFWQEHGREFNLTV